jgi:hypothetical protein
MTTKTLSSPADSALQPSLSPSPSSPSIALTATLPILPTTSPEPSLRHLRLANSLPNLVSRRRPTRQRRRYIVVWFLSLSSSTFRWRGWAGKERRRRRQRAIGAPGWMRGWSRGRSMDEQQAPGCLHRHCIREQKSQVVFSSSFRLLTLPSANSGLLPTSPFTLPSHLRPLGLSPRLLGERPRFPSVLSSLFLLPFTSFRRISLKSLETVSPILSVRSPSLLRSSQSTPRSAHPSLLPLISTFSSSLSRVKAPRQPALPSRQTRDGQHASHLPLFPPLCGSRSTSTSLLPSAPFSSFESLTSYFALL